MAAGASRSASPPFKLMRGRLLHPLSSAPPTVRRGRRRRSLQQQTPRGNGASSNMLRVWRRQGLEEAVLFCLLRRLRVVAPPPGRGAPISPWRFTLTSTGGIPITASSTPTGRNNSLLTKIRMSENPFLWIDGGT